LSGQTNHIPVKLIHYVLDSFATGKVMVRSGQIHNQVLNYNIVTEEMIFRENNKFLAIAYPEDVDTILIHERKFIPVNNVFYELISNNKYPLFVKFTSTVKEPGTQTGFGATNTTAATSLKSLIREGGAYVLKLPDDFQIIPVRTFFVRKNMHYYPFNNEQQFTRLFPEKKQFIREWIKDLKTNFSKQEDLILLIKQLDNFN